MSIEMHVFLRKDKIPDRASWQDSVTSLDLPLELDSNLNAARDRGFSPSKLRGIDSGFEIYSESAEDVLTDYPRLSEVVGERDWCLSFRWGGDPRECACVLVASAALLKLSDAVAYYPDDDLTYDLKSLLDEAKVCLSQV